jgi:hypothetical protein
MSERILCRHQQQFSLNIWIGIVADYLVDHIGLQATITDISSYMICQSYWKVYHWQSEHECRTSMMVLRHILAVLCEMFYNTYHDQWIGTGGRIAWPPSSPDLNLLNFYLWEHLKALVYAAHVGNKEALQRRIVDATVKCHFQLPRIFERLRGSMMRRVEACIESHGGYFEHLL